MKKKIIVTHTVKTDGRKCNISCPYFSGTDWPFCKLFKKNLFIEGRNDTTGLRCRRCLAATEGNQSIEF